MFSFGRPAIPLSETVVWWNLGKETSPQPRPMFLIPPRRTFRTSSRHLFPLSQGRVRKCLDFSLSNDLKVKVPDLAVYTFSETMIIVNLHWLNVSFKKNHFWAIFAKLKSGPDIKVPFYHHKKTFRFLNPDNLLGDVFAGGSDSSGAHSPSESPWRASGSPSET